MALLLAFALVSYHSAGALQQPAAGAAAVFEGARIIVGDGRPAIENGSLLVQGGRVVQAGRAADVRVPAGATRVSLAGKTVMPTIIDAHVHLSTARDALIEDLRRRAYFGVTSSDVELKMRVYETMVNSLTQRGIRPALINVTYPTAPYYRMNQ